MSDPSDKQLTDQEIIRSFKAGNLDIYEQLIERHFNKAYQIAYGILRQHQDAEEVVQDSFVKMYKVLNDFRGDSEFTTWMFRIVTNYAKNRYRWNKRRGSKQNVSIHAPISGNDSTDIVRDLPGKSMSPEKFSKFSELEQGISNNLEKISPLYREVLILRNIEGLSYERISEILDCKIGTVKSRIARGREELREKLKKEELI